MTDRPVLLLDVDGVLNPYAGPCPAGFTEHDLFPGEEPIRLNPEHGAWIGELMDVFDAAWATGWNDEANVHLAPLLGLPPLPVVRMPGSPFEPREKVPAVAAFVGRRRAVWIDDAHTAEAFLWSAERPGERLLIPVDPATGLARPDVDRALTWARAR